MKRFWRAVEVQAADGGFAIGLDGRPIRTPRGAQLRLPSAALANAIAGEWAAVGDGVRPRDMPLTGLANAAIDLVAPDPDGFAAGLAAFGASDLTCYRAERPAELVGLQVAAWEPVLKAVERAENLVFRRTAGLMPVEQPAETLARLERILAGFDPLRLAALSPLITLSGSAVLGLAVARKHLSAEAAFAAAHVDEDYQARHWGRDADAEARRAARQAEFMAAAGFLSLLAAAEGG